MTGRRRRALGIVAILCAVVVIVAAVSVSEYSRPNAPASRSPVLLIGDFGPKVTLAGGVEESPRENNSTIVIQLFSAVPAKFAPAGLLSSSLGAFVELLNATVYPQNNTTALFLSPVFDEVAQEWTAVMTHDSGTNWVSLTLEATRTVVESNGTVQIYMDYNNVLYDPWDVPVETLNQTELSTPAARSWFDGTNVSLTDYSSVTIADVGLNLSLQFPPTPVQTVKMPGADLRTSSVAPETGCSPTPCTYYYDTYPSTTSATETGESYVNGTLPLLVTHLGQTVDGGLSEIDSGATVAVEDDTIDLNSAQPYLSQSGTITTTMSTTPSFAHVANLTVGSGGNGLNAFPYNYSRTIGNFNEDDSLNRTTLVVGVGGIEYGFPHFNQFTYGYTDEWKESCVEEDGGIYCELPKLVSQTLTSTTYDGNYTTGEILDVNSTAGLQVTAENVPIDEAWVIQHMLGSGSAGTVSLTVGGADQNYSSSTVWDNLSGYLDASDALKKGSQDLEIFSTAISLGLTIADTLAAANGLDFDAEEPEIVADSLNLIAETIKMSATILADMSSISTVGGTASVTLTSFFANDPLINPGSNYTMDYFESGTPISFTEGSTQYSFYAPEDFLNATAIES